MKDLSSNPEKILPIDPTLPLPFPLSPISIPFTFLPSSRFSTLFLSYSKMELRGFGYIVVLTAIFTAVNARIPGVYTGGQWESAHATFYGGADASGTMGLSTFPPFSYYDFLINFGTELQFKSNPPKQKLFNGDEFGLIFFFRWSMWVWEFVQPRLRREHGGAEHGAVQQWAELRCLFRTKMYRRPSMVSSRKPFYSHHRHQFLSAELRSAQ